MVWWLLWGCGGGCEADGVCRVDGGQYEVESPEADGPWPVMVYLHGHNSTPEEVRDRAAVQDWRKAGWLVVLPAGKNGTWSNVGSPHDDRDDLTFVSAVLDDVSDRFDVQDTVVVSGFSQGSSMAWDVACYLPERVDALVGVSGVSWEPQPASCDGPVPVRHTHGLSDGIMPMEGRPIGSTHQGDVYVGIEAWRATNGCSGEGRDEVEGPEVCTVWDTCSRGAEVRLCLHEGGHRTPQGWAGRAMAWVDDAR